MFARTILARAILGLWSTALIGQQTPATSSAPALHEFPVILQQTVESGRTSVGAKIQAKLAVATLVNGTVIPKNAVLSGVVVESVARSAKDHARLTVRMDSVEWKGGSASIKGYLTPSYYPTTEKAGQSLQYGPPQPPSKTWNGAGQYPSADSRVYQPFPGSDSGKDAGSVPETSTSVISSRPTLMKDVQAAPSNDGGIALVCERANLKLDKLTTYVLVTAELSSKVDQR